MNDSHLAKQYVMWFCISALSCALAFRVGVRFNFSFSARLRSRLALALPFLMASL